VSIISNNWFWSLESDSKQKSLENPSTPLSEEVLAGEEGKSSDGIVVNTNTILSIPEFSRALQIKSGIMASLPFAIVEYNQDEQIHLPEHPTTKLINQNPSHLYSAYTFIETLVTHLELYDNFYAWIRREQRSEKIKELRILDPTKVVVDLTDRGTKRFKYINEEGKESIYLDDRVFHIHGHGTSGLGGIDKIKIHQENYALALAHRKYLANFNANGTFLSGVLRHPAQLKPESAKRLRKSWRTAYGGAGKSGGVAVLEEGLEYQPLTATPTDAGSEATKAAITADIARITGTPKILLEDYSDATLNNAEAIGQFFVNYTIRPLAEKLEAEITRKLLTEKEKEDHKAHFDLKGLLRPDAKSQAAFIEALMKYGTINDDEARAIVGMNPKTDGSGKEYHKPLNYADVNDNKNNNDGND